MAAVVLETADLPLESPHRLRVLVVTTGNKCAAGSAVKRQVESDTRGHVLRDSHAEVLARRALVRLLYADLLHLHTGSSIHADAPAAVASAPSLLELRTDTPRGEPRFQLKGSLRVHLYVSDAPCGDASIYPLNAALPAGAPGMNFTGAKAVRGGELCREPDRQATGVLRLKSMRSDLRESDRSACMCCSDKLARWAVTGVQGRLLGQFVSPLHFATVTVSMDPLGQSPASMEAALRRALHGRVNDARVEGRTPQPPPQPRCFVTSRAFPASLQATRHATSGGATCSSSNSTSASSGVCMNFIASVPLRPCKSGFAFAGDVEVTVGASGRKQGASRKATSLSTCSRLSQVRLFEQYQRVRVALGLAWASDTYAACKERCGTAGAWQAAHDAFSEWVWSDRSLGEFRLQQQEAERGGAGVGAAEEHAHMQRRGQGQGPPHTTKKRAKGEGDSTGGTPKKRERTASAGPIRGP